MLTADRQTDKQIIIYQLAKYERDPMKNGRAIAERR